MLFNLIPTKMPNETLHNCLYTFAVQSTMICASFDCLLVWLLPLPGNHMSIKANTIASDVIKHE